ncbi:NAD(+)/NADH kinase [Oscillospiraceae bacterium MB08-C2-2]|nr:NAD(+)/NADH kinase [Oscillospiraceae bacterium MB08-C2-2]
MNILIRPNFDKKGSLECVRKAASILLGHGAQIFINEADRSFFDDPQCRYGPMEEIIPLCDVLISVGGDGTILRTVKAAIPYGKPVLGINTGRIGFLTQLEEGELEDLALLVRGEYSLASRMMLKARIEGSCGEDFQYHALNDLVITRIDSNNIADMVVTAQEGRVSSFRADGLIFSTPTGSTAYSMSAGGPILDPSLDAIIMTAICPHAAITRPMVLRTDRSYCLCESQSSSNRGGLSLSVDGRTSHRILLGECIYIEKSTQTATLVDFGKKDFYWALNKKFSIT